MVNAIKQNSTGETNILIHLKKFIHLNAHFAGHKETRLKKCQKCYKMLLDLKIHMFRHSVANNVASSLAD